MDLCNDDDSENDDSYVTTSEREWQSLKTSRLKEGFREGVSCGQASSVQDGFNNGFEVGFRCIKDAAKLRGHLWALQGIIQHRQSLNERNKCDVIKQLQIFVEKLQTIEQAIIERAKHECSTYKTTINSRKSTTQDQLIDTVHNPADIRNELQPVNFHQELESIKETCIQICNDIGIGISFDLKN